MGEGKRGESANGRIRPTAGQVSSSHRRGSSDVLPLGEAKPRPHASSETVSRASRCKLAPPCPQVYHLFKVVHIVPSKSEVKGT